MTPDQETLTLEADADGMMDGPAHLSEFQKLIQWEVPVWEDGHAVVTCTLRPEYGNRRGGLHGGLVATLMDAVGGHAALGPPPKEPFKPGPPGVTLSLTINFIGTAKEGRLIATARRTGGGRTIAFVQIEVADDKGNRIAEGTGTFRKFPAAD